MKEVKRRFWVEKTAVVFAQPNDIFRVLEHLEEWPRWTPSITRISILSNGQPTPGVKIKVLQPKLPPSIWTIIKVDGDKAITWKKRSLGLRMVAEHFISDDATGTRVTIRITYEGILAGLAYRLSHKLTDRYMAMEINGLKEECEKG